MISEKLKELINNDDSLCGNYKSLANDVFNRNVIDLVDFEGTTLLHHSVILGREDLVRLCLESGANPNTRDYFNRSVMYSAVRNTSASIVRDLIKYGANVHGEYSLLKEAIMGNNLEIVKVLIESGISINANPEYYHVSALFNAVLYNSVSIVKYLLDEGCEIDLKDAGGNGVFEVAINRHIEIMPEIVSMIDEARLQRQSSEVLISEARMELKKLIGK